ncbi:MAG: c-type cytochrome [Acidimicrobiia bacterium]|nr:c-type cytochrome [Acidimicrobiia bacterium]
MPMRPDDPELEESTDRWLKWGAGLLFLLALAFPLYRFLEPGRRADAREQLTANLAAQGREIFVSSCVACHGINGEGVDAPALNSQQFLTATADEQVIGLISVGVPGSGMSAYSLDFGGPMTSEQIKAVSVYLRSLEEEAPDRPDWRLDGVADAHDDEEPTAAHDDEEPVDDGRDDDEDAEAVDDEPVFVAADAFITQCARCHGIDLGGTNNGPGIGPAAHSLSEPDEHLVEVISLGRNDMPAWAEVFSEQEIAALVAYIRAVQRGEY